MFEGNQQHDAHELYIFLLDNLRETSKDVFKFASQYNLTASPSSPHYLSLSSPSSPSPSSSSANSLLTTGSSSSTKKIQDKLKKSIKRFRANNSQDSKKNLMTASTNSLNNERHYDKNGDVLGGASGALADSGACFLDMNNITEDFQVSDVGTAREIQINSN